MIVFLDTSVILAACGSTTGASRVIISQAEEKGWSLISCEYAGDETVRNLPKFDIEATLDWESIRRAIHFVSDILTFDRPVVFEPTKDRPVLFTAAARADVLLTLDEEDFGQFYGRPFYGLEVLEPGEFLKKYRPPA